MSRPAAGAAVRGGAAILTLAATTVGLPLLLYRLGGSPIPARVPSLHAATVALMHRDNGYLFLGAVRDVSWLAWAAFTLAVLAESQAAVRGRPAPRLYLAGLQGPAARLVAAASVAFTSPVAVTLATSPAMAATALTARPAIPGHTVAPGSAAARERPATPEHPAAVTLDAFGTHSGPARSAAAHRTVVVRPGDCLWTLAQRYLGAGDRYPELARLNLGRDMGDGQKFTDPSLIQPGWRLILPDTGPQPGHGSPPHQQHQGDHQKHAAHQHPGHPSGSSRFGRSHRSAHSGGTQSGGTGGDGTPEAAGSGSRPGELAPGQHEEVEQAVLFTLGMLAGAALVTLERLRHRQRQNRRAGRRIALPADAESQRIEQKLRAASPPAPPGSLRDALCDLSEGVARGGDPLPPIVGIHLTRDRIDVLLSAPAAGPPPPPFTTAPGRQGMCWTADLRDASPEWTTAPLVPGEVGDLLPGLFTAGSTEDGGYLLLDLEAMRVTCCDGQPDLVDRLLVTAATELASSRWSGWYDLVLAGCDELDVLGRAERCRDLDEALDLLEARTRTVATRLAGDRQADVRTQRMSDPEDEDWGLTLLVSRMAPTPGQMARLLGMADGPGGVAALVAGDTLDPDGKLAPAVLRLEPCPDGPGDMRATITLSYLGPQHQLTVWPQTLTLSEYEALAGLFAAAADTSDVGQDAEPYADYGGPPWMRFAAAPVAPGTLADAPAQGAGPGDGDPDGGGLREPGPAEPGVGGPGSGEAGSGDAGLAAGSEFERPVSFPEPAGLGDLPGQGGIGDPPRPGEAPAPGRRARHGVSEPVPQLSRPADRHRAPSLSVNVLGPFELTGSAEPLLSKQAELVLALALHAPVGLSNSALCALLGADADHPRPADWVRQLITRTRRRLGQAPDGQEYIIHLGSGIYALHKDVRLDWADFSALARRGRSGRSAADLRAALALVRGQPFAECYHWWIDVALVEHMRAEIVDAAELLAQLELEQRDPVAARQAAQVGLSAETAAEQLWRALMRAEYEAGNPEGVAQAWSSCLDAITEIAPGGEPHPDTERLFRQLSRGDDYLSLHG